MRCFGRFGIVVVLALLVCGCTGFDRVVTSAATSEAKQTTRAGIGGAFDLLKKRVRIATSDANLSSDCGDQTACIEAVADALFVEPRTTYMRTQYATILAQKGTIVGYTPATKKNKGGAAIYFNVDQAIADALAKMPVIEGEPPFGPTALALAELALRTGKYLQ